MFKQLLLQVLLLGTVGTPLAAWAQTDGLEQAISQRESSSDPAPSQLLGAYALLVRGSVHVWAASLEAILTQAGRIDSASVRQEIQEAKDTLGGGSSQAKLESALYRLNVATGKIVVTERLHGRLEILEEELARHMSDGPLADPAFGTPLERRFRALDSSLHQIEGLLTQGKLDAASKELTRVGERLAQLQQGMSRAMVVAGRARSQAQVLRSLAGLAGSSRSELATQIAQLLADAQAVLESLRQGLFEQGLGETDRIAQQMSHILEKLLGAQGE